jgi:hypothetical protein
MRDNLILHETRPEGNSHSTADGSHQTADPTASIFDLPEMPSLSSADTELREAAPTPGEGAGGSSEGEPPAADSSPGSESRGQAPGGREEGRPSTALALPEDWGPLVPPEERLARLVASINEADRLYGLATLDGLAHAARAGQALIEFKALLPRGQYQAFLRIYCPSLSLRIARYYKWVATHPEEALQKTERRRQSVAAPRRQLDSTPAGTESPARQGHERRDGDACSFPAVGDGGKPGRLVAVPRIDPDHQLAPRPRYVVATRRDAEARRPNLVMVCRPVDRQAPRSEGPEAWPIARGAGAARSRADDLTRLCLLVVEAADDVAGETGDESMADDELRRLVPLAIRRLCEVARALGLGDPLTPAATP